MPFGRLTIEGKWNKSFSPLYDPRNTCVRGGGASLRSAIAAVVPVRNRLGTGRGEFQAERGFGRPRRKQPLTGRVELPAVSLNQTREVRTRQPLKVIHPAVVASSTDLTRHDVELALRPTVDDL